MKRYGTVIQVRPEKLMEYKELHANTWAGVLEANSACNIRNYSIYFRDGLLFSYFEYVGEDFEADMSKMKTYSEVQRWWKLTDACQKPVETAAEGEWWSPMEEVFHQD